MAVRYLILSDIALPLESGKIDAHCAKIDDQCWDFGKAQELFLLIDELIARVVRENSLEISRDTAKTVTFRDLVRDAALAT
jgi:hypothetical protein